MSRCLPLLLGLVAGCPPQAPHRTDSGQLGGDDDGDGYTRLEGDCDDTRVDVHPGADDPVGDDLDANCDGIDGVDDDGDSRASLASGGTDCDDTRPDVYPGATETGWDGVDQDCDGSDLHDFDRLCGGARHTCGIDSTGAIRCWGADDERTIDAPPRDGTLWLSLSCSEGGTCAVSDQGTLRCWGPKADAATQELVTEGNALDASGPWSAVFLGGHHRCVLDDSKTATCFGVDPGDGRIDDVPGNVAFDSMGLGDTHTCGITGGEGRMRCYPSGSVYDTLIPDPQNSSWFQVDGGNQIACALRTSGALDCWGDSDHGGTAPQNQAGSWTDLSIGRNFLCAVDDRTVDCSGLPTDTWGVLARAPDTRVSHVAAGFYHVCALDLVRSEPLCWGRGENGVEDGQATVPAWE